MASLVAGKKVKVVKKKTNKFVRFQSDQFKRVKASWRKPRGIDNRCRRKFRGNRPLPGAGYGTPKATRYMSKDGLKTCVVRNLKELEAFMTLKSTYKLAIAHQVSARNRSAMVDRAAELGIKLINAKAKLETVDKQ